MDLHSHAVSCQDTTAALQALHAQLDGVSQPQLVFAFHGAGHEDQRVFASLRTRFPEAALIGGTSSGGLLTDTGVHDAHSIGVLCLHDPDGDYGVAAAELGSDAAATAQQLLIDALASCGCAGELPELVWIYQAPGREEQVLEGLRRVVGDRCPIIGGSSADDDVSGAWRQLGPQGSLTDGLVVAVLFPSRPVRYAFQGGYEPVGPSGVVTQIGYHADGHQGVVTARRGREILEIDGEPAAQVYNRWSQGRIAAQLGVGGSVLLDTTLLPLATVVGQADGVSHYLLAHPDAVTAEGGLRTFCDLGVGDRVYAMRGDRERLIERAGRVALQARRALPQRGDGSRVAGALLVYCGGCKLAVGEQIDRVKESVATSIDGAPFIGCFTFGEQGRLLDRNRHGNLMISAVVFGD